jgi:hypothetical protein
MRWTKLDRDCICFTKIKLTHRFFKSLPSISTSWINRVNFLYFSVQSTGITSSLSPPRCRLSSDRCHYITVSCHASIPLSQDEFATYASSSDNALFHRLPHQAETEALNPHHRRRLSSSDHPTLTLHCYKKIISTLSTLSTSQLHLYFASSLARAACHRSSTRRCHFLSPPSHAIIHPHNDTHNDKLVNPLSLSLVYEVT